MNWRPWVLAFFIIFSIGANSALVYNERGHATDSEPELRQVEEVLRHLQYMPTARRSNFMDMGMDQELADATAGYMDVYGGLKPKFEKMLKEQGLDVSKAFCPGDGPPQPYAALEFLVAEENGRREVLDPNTLMRFEPQPWYAVAPVQPIYNHIELSPNRKAEATVMGVSALLVHREDDALAGRSPWSMGMMGSFSFASLERDNPSIRKMAISYFSLMHFLTELANSKDGICGG